jgi:hypothetical protein
LRKGARLKAPGGYGTRRVIDGWEVPPAVGSIAHYRVPSNAEPSLFDPWYASVLVARDQLLGFRPRVAVLVRRHFRMRRLRT